MLRPSSVQLARSTVPVRLVLLATLLLLLASLLPAAAATPFGARTALAGHTPTPASVNLVGDPPERGLGRRVRRLGPGLRRLGVHGAGQRRLPVPVRDDPGRRLAVQGRDGRLGRELRRRLRPDGPNIARNLADDQTVRFYYDHKTHYIADSVGNTIYTVPGNFNDELGCAGDWQPDCLRTLHLRRRWRRHVHVRDDGHPGRQLRVQGRDRRELDNPNYGDGGGPDNVPFSVAQPGSTVTFSLQHGDATSPRSRVEGASAGARQQHRVGRPPPRLARHAVPDARRRGRRRARPSRSASARSTTTSPR